MIDTYYSRWFVSHSVHAMWRHYDNNTSQMKRPIVGIATDSAQKTRKEENYQSITIHIATFVPHKGWKRRVKIKKNAHINSHFRQSPRCRIMLLCNLAFDAKFCYI